MEINREIILTKTIRKDIDINQIIRYFEINPKNKAFKVASNYLSLNIVKVNSVSDTNEAGEVLIGLQMYTSREKVL